jgi:hypothetical protein
MRVEVDRAESRVGEVVWIAVGGAEPGRPVTVILTGEAASGSWARFTARRDGWVDLSEDAPIEGTYDGVDPMGLFWSARVRSPQSGTDLAPTEWHLTATGATGSEAAATVTRRLIGDEIVRQPIREGGLANAVRQRISRSIITPGRKRGSLVAGPQDPL